MTDKKFENLKVGDNVFVAYQNERYREKANLPRVANYETVVKVGRKFGYIRKYHRDMPFCLYTGRSEHKESNARSNGYGFDVFADPDEYNRYLEAVSKAQKLNRLVSRMSFVHSLSPEQVNKILEVIECET